MFRSPGVPTPDELEARITELRAAVRRAMAAGDRDGARGLRAELRDAERAWDDAVLGDAPAPAAASRNEDRRGLQPVREQVHQALTLLGAPAAPKLIGTVYAAFFPGEIPGQRLASLRRDEERSFRTAPYARPYYLCAALTADMLAPARGLLTVSTWPLERRIVGPLSPRADFLTSAIRLAEHAERGTPSPDARRLLWRFASTIPGAATGTVGTVEPAALAAAARAELDVHRDRDLRRRESAARRARDRLDDAQRLFGSRLRAVRESGRPAARNAAPDPAHDRETDG
ncbi:hypothetical protein ACFOY4_10445 [Actinomadura syzygii]|uniref:Uncharacterized protein n=1 Tax=Actinomadura syzygii TaxID=1427538 RepID=A0A5D0UDA8_9ACTN|nr:hypothetical protein [Actinomadura syzygii]TYC15780.1 hypothetical protein FXF65_10525 [Actinomadura syzygii]